MKADDGGIDRAMAVNRRTLLVGGGVGAGLVLAWGLWPRSYRPNIVAAPGEAIFNAFVKIGEDGHVAIVVPQAEMGQGVYTSLPQILADELGADWRTVSVEPAPIGPLYANDFLVAEGARDMLPGPLQGVGGWAAREFATRSAMMITGGSTSIRGFEQRFREAGAAARALLCMAAGARWDAEWQACDTEAGFVTRGEDRLRFGELAAEAAALTPPAVVPLRAIGAGNISGRNMPRLDLPAKVDGSTRYAADVRLQDMVFAAVRHAPLGAASLTAIDRKAAEKVPGTLALFENPGWVAAVASNWWAADRAVQAIAPRFTHESAAPDTASIDKALADAIEADKGEAFVETGDVEAVFAGAKVHRADYAVPVAVHAAIEPMTATARRSGDRVELWVPTQAPGVTRAAVARALGLKDGQVTIYPMPIGGGFGLKGESQAAVEAAIIATRMKRPVQLTWSRGEDIAQDRVRPPARGRLAAALGPRGEILGWQARIAAPAVMASMQSRMSGNGPGDSGGATAEAMATHGAEPPYAIPAVRVTHLPADIGIPTGMWRGVAHSYTAFFTECFIDELARLAGGEPFSYRMQMIGQNPRLAHCLTTVTALGGWDGGVPGSNQGLAAHSAFGSHIALLAEARVGDDQGIQVDRVFAAVDCGRIINPDIARQQIEGGIIWGIAGALGATTSYTRGQADVTNFDGLNLPVLATTPEIRIELIRNREAPGGLGELAVPPVAPAIANALFAATGHRLRTLPLRAGGK